MFNESEQKESEMNGFFFLHVTRAYPPMNPCRYQDEARLSHTALFVVMIPSLSTTLVQQKCNVGTLSGDTYAADVPKSRTLTHLLFSSLFPNTFHCNDF